jgi:glutathione S-transferase
MSLTFYRAPMSTATITDLVLAELGIPHETVTLDIQKGDTKKPEFLKVNPNGKVPVIVHDGTVIFESAAITIHLGETFGVEKNVWPSDRLKRGEAIKWVVWSNVSLGDAVGRWMRNTMDWVPAEQRNAKAGEAGQKDMRDLLGILDASLDGRDYLTGSQFTLADAHVNSFLDWLRFSKVDFTPFARLEAWSKRCSARPGYQKVMADKKG